MAEQDVAMQVLQQVAKLPVVKVDRRILQHYWNRVLLVCYLRKAWIELRMLVLWIMSCWRVGHRL